MKLFIWNDKNIVGIKNLSLLDYQCKSLKTLFLKMSRCVSIMVVLCLRQSVLSLKQKVHKTLGYYSIRITQTRLTLLLCYALHSPSSCSRHYICQKDIYGHCGREKKWPGPEVDQCFGKSKSGADFIQVSWSHTVMVSGVWLNSSAGTQT